MFDWGWKMMVGDRRSGIDTRSEEEKRLTGERRSSTESRANAPSNEQLALFARRLKRTIRDDRGRLFFGVANGDQDFALYPDVIRVVEWLERVSQVDVVSDDAPLRKSVLRKQDDGP
ncbi:hypothetical protein JQ631_10045 [Bradyrhizobium manausense]|jgi:hypothetical protein|uniref:hypothetical protein n=1 Tax=Bradyrhizobium manausense TaxID=989370 RepID=UPI001BACF72B|nr:hypothetical protein [Bradyrhizobium manausense]MBR0789411.1 hypothetical protein [Bradyrhizobium manausense]